MGSREDNVNGAARARGKGGGHDGLHKVNVPLRHQVKPVPFPANFHQTISNEYAVQYLEKLGVNANAENIKTLLREMPVDRCHLTAAWRAKGWLTDSVHVKPDGKRRRRPKGQFTLEDEPIQQDDVTLDDGATSTNGKAAGASVGFHTDVDQAVDHIASAAQRTLGSDSGASAAASLLSAGSAAGSSRFSSSRGRTVPSRRRRLSSRSNLALAELLKPVDVTLDVLLMVQTEFCRSFHFDRFRLDAPEVKDLQDLLVGPSVIRLTGLVIHFLYWNMLRPHAMENVDFAELQDPEPAAGPHPPPHHHHHHHHRNSRQREKRARQLQQQAKEQSKQMEKEAEKRAKLAQYAQQELDDSDKQRLFLEMMRAFTALQSTVRAEESVFNHTTLAILLLSLRTAVDRVVVKAFRWFRLGETDAPDAADVLTSLQQEVKLRTRKPFQQEPLLRNRGTDLGP